jgi:hypothetical protein
MPGLARGVREKVDLGKDIRYSPLDEQPAHRRPHDRLERNVLPPHTRTMLEQAENEHAGGSDTGDELGKEADTQGVLFGELERVSAVIQFFPLAFTRWVMMILARASDGNVGDMGEDGALLTYGKGNMTRRSITAPHSRVKGRPMVTPLGFCLVCMVSLDPGSSRRFASALPRIACY